MPYSSQIIHLQTLQVLMKEVRLLVSMNHTERLQWEPHQKHGIWVIFGKWNNQLWSFAFHIVEAHGSILLGLNTPRKKSLFTKYPKMSTETIDIHPEQQNLARCDPKEVASTIHQGVAAPGKEAHHPWQANNNLISKDQGYVKPSNINNGMSDSFSEELGPEVDDDPDDWVDATIHSLLAQNDAISSSIYI